MGGGEPLLAGSKWIERFMDRLVPLAPQVAVAVQSNGTIYTDEFERVLLRHRRNLSYSVSIDGAKRANDRHRVTHSGDSSFRKVEATLRRARAAGVLDGVLMVVDTRNSPAEILEFMRSLESPRYDLLLPDGDHDSPPPLKDEQTSTRYGEWLWSFFCEYASQKAEFEVRLLDDIAVSLLKKGRGLIEPAITHARCVLTVDVDGEIKQSDTYRISKGSLDILERRSIFSSSLSAAANSRSNLRVVTAAGDLHESCRTCKYLDACGGGYPQHRVLGGSMKNASIYCSDYLFLLNRMEQALCP
jgi:uncharacterized protein